MGVKGGLRKDVIRKPRCGCQGTDRGKPHSRTRTVQKDPNGA